MRRPSLLTLSRLTLSPLPFSRLTLFLLLALAACAKQSREWLNPFFRIPPPWHGRWLGRGLPPAIC